MNEKSGMDAVELDKNIVNSKLPLFQDVEKVPKKRIIIKVDSVSGCTT